MKLLISAVFLVYHHSSVVLGIGLVNSRSWVQIVKSYWNKFLKVIFLPKNYFSFAFCTFISVLCYFIYHHQTISSWFKKLYLGVMNHFNHSATNLKIITNKYAFMSIRKIPFRRLKNNCMIQVNIPIFSVNRKPYSAFCRVYTQAMFYFRGPTI